ncbi:MAG TPA: hypothetical protein VF637_07720 [Sphingomicrobium sp.]|jgi:hypothetical protein
MDRLDALTVRESNGKSFWTKIGAAFPNKNGAGYIVRLDAMPASVDGQFSIHLREPLPKDGQAPRQSAGSPPTNTRGGYAGQPADDDFDSVPF